MQVSVTWCDVGCSALLSTTPSTAVELNASRQWPDSDVAHRPTWLSRDPVTSPSMQFRDCCFRFGNLLPVECASIFPFLKSSTLVFVAFSRLRFDLYADVTVTSSTGRLPVLVASSGGGGDLRLIFILIPLSTIVARWSDEPDIFCRSTKRTAAVCSSSSEHQVNKSRLHCTRCHRGSAVSTHRPTTSVHWWL